MQALGEFEKGQCRRRSLALVEYRQADLSRNRWLQRLFHIAAVRVFGQRAFGHHGQSVATANRIQGAEQLRTAKADVGCQPCCVEQSANQF
ncbi:hypothetical protein D3C76_1558300 [compost metagenome]